jgi:hypothetical protein
MTPRLRHRVIHEGSHALSNISFLGRNGREKP